MALLVSDREAPSGGIVRTLTLSRPDRRNALDPPTLDALRAALDAAVRDGVRVLVVTGDGAAFCSGYDLGLGDLAPAGDALPDETVLRTMAAVRDVPLPTVARVNGAAYGAGFELAISCDLRVAAADAVLCLPPARLGIAYAPGGLARLASLVGTAVARRLVFTAEPVPAERARTLGLVDDVVEKDKLDDAVRQLADGMAGAAPMAVRAMKRTLNALEARLSDADREAADADRRSCYASEDVAEGLAAFAQRRAPKFRGR